MIHSRFGKLVVGVIAVLAVAFMSIGTGFASVGQIDDGLGVFAQGNGNGNGQGNGNGPGDNDDADDPDGDNDEDNGNNGQGNGRGGDDDDTDADEESRDNGDGNGNNDDDADDPDADTDEDNGNNGQGNGRGGDDESDDDDATGSDDDDATPSDDSGKVGICHNTGSETNPLVYIEVSENAAAAHEAHGDTIGVDSEDDCDLDPDDGTPIATPATGA